MSHSWNNDRFRVAQDLAVGCLDKGTRSHTKDEISEALEPVGARLTIYTDGLRVRVSGRCLREDFPTVVALMKDQLFAPVFLPEEVERVRDRMRAAYRRSMTDTGYLASSALSRLIYQPDHPNFTADTLADLETLESITVDEIRMVQQSWIPLGAFRFSIAGDIDRDLVEKTFMDHSTESGPDISISTDGEPDTVSSKKSGSRLWHGAVDSGGRPSIQTIPIPGKDSLDVRLGHAVDLSVLDDEIRPLTLGVFALGGNFSARLMTRVRDELGLTYGIGSSLSGFDLYHHGAWTVTVTLSKDKLEEGLEETRNEIRLFADNGISAAELEEKKQTLCGMHKVSLSTTAQIAGALLRNAEKHRDPGYLDRYPDLIERVDLDAVNSLIKDFLRPEELHCAISGSIDPSVTSVSPA